MTTSGNKSKPQPQAKSRHAKSKEASDPGPAKAKAAIRRPGRNVDAAIAKLDVSSLHEDDITSILLQCASVLHFRKALGKQDISKSEPSPSYCYTKAGDSSAVNIWSGGFKVGETSEADAVARGIPPCG